ncbi:membrane protein [Bacillus phage Chotacabras]|nr:membrane protein [Bacillus phage Chotacabras]
MLRTSNLLSIFFLSLWTFFCLGAFYQTAFGELAANPDFKELGNYLGILGVAQLLVVIINLYDLWKER